MFYATLRTLTQVVVTSLVVGTILAFFGVTTDQLMHTVGLSTERVEDYARKGFAWAASSNLLLGALVTVPIWFVIFLFRPPRQSSSK